MARNQSYALLALAVLASIATFYFYLTYVESTLATSHIQVSRPVRPHEAPSAPQIIERSPGQPRLPRLAESDSFVVKALVSLIGNKSLMKWFNTERLIHNIVATIDNLPRDRLPRSVMPVRQAPGYLQTSAAENDIVISQENAKRYTPYIQIADAISAKNLVDLYVRIYPLFQQAYERLGYPKQYFNDRLMEVLDDLLDAPDISGPVKLVQPQVFYQYADPDIEARSIGQRTLVRLGSANEAMLKDKLRAIKAELLLHMHSAADQDSGSAFPALNNQKTRRSLGE